MKAPRLLPVLVLSLAGCASAGQYSAATTYPKLARQYPFISIAGAALPAGVGVRRNLTYTRPGARPLQLDLYLPHGMQAAPVVLLVHGGGWRSGERANLAPLAVRLAQRGYAAATISYRLSPEARYPAALDDVKAALAWVRAHAHSHRIDPSRVAIAGGSAGGQIASLVGLASPGAVQAIVNIDGLSDFTSAEARLHEDDPAKKPSAAGAWFGGTFAEKPALWREASPLFHVSAASPPVLFIGSGEPRFSVGRREMLERLAAHRVAADVVVFPDTPHSFWLFDPWLAPTVETIDSFLRKHL